jgi:hypothetical protein
MNAIKWLKPLLPQLDRAVPKFKPLMCHQFLQGKMRIMTFLLGGSKIALDTLLWQQWLEKVRPHRFQQLHPRVHLAQGVEF